MSVTEVENMIGIGGVTDVDVNKLRTIVRSILGEGADRLANSVIIETYRDVYEKLKRGDYDENYD